MINQNLLNKLSTIFYFDMNKGNLEQEIEWNSLEIISFLTFLLDEFNHSESPENMKKIENYNGLISYVETIQRESL